MNRAEREAKVRKVNSRNLVDEVGQVFKQRPSEKTVLRVLNAKYYDMSVLKNSVYPMFRLTPPGEPVAVTFVYFKRDSSVEDLDWSEDFRSSLIHRP